MTGKATYYAYDPCRAEIVTSRLSDSKERKCGRNRAAVAVLSLLLVVSFLVIVVLTVKYIGGVKVSPPVRCSSEPCIRVAYRMLSGMNKSADPCDDFYKYSCGGWQSKHSIPHYHRNAWTVFDELQYDVDTFLRAQLEIPHNSSEQVGLANAKAFYHMCMDLERRESYSLESMQNKILELGGAPMTGFWTKRNLTDVLIDLLSLNVHTLVKVQPRNNEQDSSKRLLSILPPDVKPYFTTSEESQLQQVIWWSKYLALLFETNVTEYAQTIINYGNAINQIAVDFAIHSESGSEEEWESQLFTIQELQSHNQTHIDWLSLARHFLGPDINDSYIVHVKSVEYLYHLEDFLSITPLGDVTDGMMGQLLLAYLDYMPPTVQVLQVLLIRNSQEDPFYETPPMWHACLENTKLFYPLVLANIYLTGYFTHKEEIRNDVSEMIASVRSSYEKSIRELPWMDDVTKSRAIFKLSRMKHFVGYEELSLNMTFVDMASSTVVIRKRSSYLSTVFVLMKEKVLSELKTIVTHEEDMHESMRSPFVVNAFYDMRNSFYIMAAVLNGVFYGYNNPSYINYAAMGYVIGHEISHGFDDDGRKYNFDGNLHMWWQSESAEVFHQKKQCFVDQYGSMTATAEGVSYQVNGNLTLSENMADNGGLKSAYMAYEQWLQKHGSEKLLPESVGADTWQQAFFISSAQLWCAKYSSAGLEGVTLVDNHSPADVRVNGVVKNFPQFAETFRCPAGSPMNPPIKCQVW